ncbi:hypothetical protein AB0C76_12960 [Kitasatospora sp. NPDC048722]|uniref:hypothetical protein n=1 Tax=Kitasatospora sp. NPDC048722 TaxID=3155639 RepID=UPI0033FC27A4
MLPGGADLNLGCPVGRPCFGPEEPAAWPLGEATVDQLVAAARCETLLQDSLDAIRPMPVWQSAPPRSGVRLPPPGAGDGLHWYVTRGRDVLTIVSEARRAVLAGAVEGHWRRRGWTITALGVGRELPRVAATTRDGYQLVLEFGDLGEVGLIASSPGADRPEHPSRTQAADGCGRAPLPYVCCSHWSAMA